MSCPVDVLPMDEVNRLGNLPGEQINEAKKVLAFELTKMFTANRKRLMLKAAEALLAVEEIWIQCPPQK